MHKQLGALLMSTACIAATALAQLPDPKTGGLNQGPVSVLVMLGAGGEGTMKLDATVEEKLKARGFVVRQVSDLEPLSLEYLEQFNAVVVGALDDFNGGGYYAPGGVVLMNTAQNVKLLQHYVAAGGGLLFMAGIDSGSTSASTSDQVLAPWKIRMGWEVIRDEANAVADPAAPGKPWPYAWTRAITDSPLTKGVKALAYPTCVMRWDDMYPNVPVYPEDPAWQVLVRGEKTSAGMRMGNASRMVPGDAGAAPAMVAVREAGKGRVAVMGLTPYYLITHAFSDKGQLGEQTTGPLAGIAFERGDGKTTSQWGLLLENLLCWAAEGSRKAGFGGQPPVWESKLKSAGVPDDPVPSFAMVDWRTQMPPPTWSSHSPTPTWWRGNAFYDEIPDPMALAPQKMNRVLVGAHSAYSDGKGSVAEWAAAAKAAGYDVVVFSERFEDFKGDAATWSKFINDCQASSDSRIACLQGLDIPDSYGNRYLILGSVNFPNSGMLTPDGKALEMTARLSLGFSQHIAVMHRCGESKLSKELYRHFQGISVYTYAEKDGKFQLADDGFAAYQWQLNNASQPVPLAIHELRDPADVAAKGTLGYQLIVPGQDALDSRRYFRYGMGHFFENPQRYFITDGPLIDSFAIFNKDIGDPALNRDHWRAVVGARTGDPAAVITEAVLYDRGEVARRWLPGASAFAQMLDGEQGYQRHFMLIVTDSKGHRAISPHLRTVPRGYFSRCGDRQNWFGAAGSYTGIWPSGVHDVWYIRPYLPAGADTETFQDRTPHPLATKMSLPFASNAMTFTTYTVNERYLRNLQYGMDAWMIHNTEPMKSYEAEALVGRWHDVKSGIDEPNQKTLPTFTTVQATMKSRIAVTPGADVAVCPVIQSVQPGATYSYMQNGALVTGVVGQLKDAALDLPAGASVETLFLLSPMTVAKNGAVGWRCVPGKEIPAGTAWQASYAFVAPTAEMRDSLGANTATPWSLTLKQGKLDNVLGVVNLTAEQYGVQGSLKAGGVVKDLPLVVKGLNSRWPAAVWTPKSLAYAFWSGLVEPKRLPGTMTGAFLQHIGVYQGIGYGTLRNSENTEFYIGNTLMASNSELNLAFTYWTPSAAGLEINNPTDKAIAARITSPRSIPGNLPIDTEVTVAPGQSLRLVLPAK